MSCRKGALLATVANLVMVTAGRPCLAQTAPGAPAVAPPAAPQTSSDAVGSTQLNEIVVTAEKRSGTVQTTPIAITAVTGGELEKRHVEDLADLGALAPSLQLIPVSQTVQASIRGVGSDFFDPRGQTSVSESIDGLAYARPAQLGNSFFDLNRVEVLNGPQGTLYGTNAAAGAVNLVSNQPVQHYDASLEASVGNYAMREYAGMVNIPILDDLAVRVAAKGIFHNGYIANYYDDASNNSVRASAKWTPTSAFTAFFAYNYSAYSGHGSSPDSYPCDPKPYSNVVSQRCTPPGSTGGNFELDGTSKTSLSTYQINLDYNFGFATATSITGYMQQAIDTNNLPNGTFFNTSIDQASHDFSEEFRLAGNRDGHRAGEFGWVVGAYYSIGNGSNFFGGFGIPTIQPRLPENSEAGFGQVTYGVTNAIRVTGGIRYTHDDKGVIDAGSDVDAPFNHVNYRVGLEGNLARDKLLYATVSTGYVAGGADGGSNSLPTPPGFVPPVFKPEDIMSYEVGSKNTFFNGRFRLNADFYYYIVKNYQGFNPGLLNTGEFGLQIQNIGNIDTYGAEITGAYVLTANDRFTFSGSLAHGEFGKAQLASFGGGPGGAVGPVLISEPAGYPLTNLPSYDARLGYTHTWRLPNDASLEAGVDTHISGAYWVTPLSNDPYDRQKSFTKTDLHLLYLTGKGLSINAWMKNAENAVVNTYSENAGDHLYYPFPPRTYGITFGYHFF